VRRQKESGARRDVQWVESCRDDAGRVEKRTVTTLARLDQRFGELDSIVQVEVLAFFSGVKNTDFDNGDVLK